MDVSKVHTIWRAYPLIQKLKEALQKCPDFFVRDREAAHRLLEEADRFEPSNDPQHYDDEHPDFPVDAWKSEVAEGATRQGYHEWVVTMHELLQENEDLAGSQQ